MKGKGEKMDINQDNKGWQDFNMFFDTLSQCMEDYIFIWDIKNEYFKISSSIFDDFNLNKNVEKNVLQYWPDIVYPDDVDRWKRNIENFLEKKDTIYHIEYRLIDKNGNSVWMSCSGRGEKDESGQIFLMLGKISNIGKQNKFDNLTGALCRNQFEYRMNEILSKKIYETGAIIIMDIDNFKNINEKYGHSFGDEVLKTIIKQITSFICVGSGLYRLDGDEFAFFYPNVSIEEAKEFFNKIQLYTNVHHEINGQKYYCTVSIGVSMYPKDGSTYVDLFRHAYSALDISKICGKNRMTFFTKQIHERKIKIIAMQGALRECIENNFNEFEIYYQPQVDSVTQKIIGAEALIRWHSSIFGEVSPVEFIPLLEESTLIIPVGKWIIDTAVSQCKKWQEFIPDFRMSVNVSYVQMKDTNLKDYIMYCIQKYNLKSDSFVLELTENCWIPDLNFLNHDFENLQKLGFTIAIDDFGTGYSSLNYLKELPVNVIKIERSFVKGIVKDSFEYIFLESIIKIAHSIHLKVCVEGIEKLEEYHTILPLKPDIIQGFLFGKPMNVKTFENTYHT